MRRKGDMMDESDQKTSAEAAARAGITRRSFVTTAAAAGAGIVIVPRHVLGRGMPGAERHASTWRSSGWAAWAAATRAP